MGLRRSTAWVVGDVMTMAGPRIGFRPDGTPVPIVDRVRWTPEPAGTVNQFWDISLDDGATFPIVAFNGTYVPNPDIVPAPSAVSGCTVDDRYRELDFLAGQWRVETGQGRELGMSHVIVDLAGCLVEEDFTTPAGYASQSFFGWDFRTESWYRNLVDTDGTRLLLEGGLEGMAMVLEGVRTTPSGPRAIRQVIEPLSGDHIRQAWFEAPSGSAWQLRGEVFFKR